MKMFEPTKTSVNDTKKRRTSLKMAVASVAAMTLPVPAAFAKGTLNYSPEMLALAEKMIASAQYKKALPRSVLNSEYLETIEIELAKFLALTQDSRIQKFSAMGKCMVSQKLMSNAELSATLGLFRAMQSGDAGKGKKALTEFRATLKKSNGESPFSTAVEEADASTAYSAGDALDDFSEVYEVATTATGAAIGVAAGGPVGGVVGAVVGKVIGKIVTSTWKALFGWATGDKKKNKKEGEGIVAGPNGEDCQPPYFGFGRIPDRL